VHEALLHGPDFVLIDVRSPQAYACAHIPGALNIPHAKIIGSRMAHYPPGLFVVYCAGPHCNGAQRGAIRLARLGLPVKLMIGGMTGWLDEGLPSRARPPPQPSAADSLTRKSPRRARCARGIIG